MALELTPTPSWPRPEFAIPFEFEYKKFPPTQAMTEKKLDNISSFWASDSDYLYLAVELPYAVDPSQERAWELGDGLVLTVSQQSQTELTDQYISLGIAGTSKKPRFTIIRSNGTWFPPVDCSKIKYRLHSSSEGSRFAISIPWSLLKPIRPLLFATLGVNLTVVSSAGDKGVTQLTPDKDFASAANPLRQVVPVEITYHLKRELAQSFLIRNCWRGEEPLQINLGLFNPETCPAQLDIAVKSGQDILEQHSSVVELAAGAHHWTLKWSPQRAIPTGKYILELSGKGYGKNYKKQHVFHILNPEDVASVRKDLLRLEEDINCIYPRAVHTGLAKLQWQEESLAQCPWCQHSLEEYNGSREILAQLNRGNNPMPDVPGLTRRAFRSQLDGDLRPYSLYLPKGFSTEQKWPLLVLLPGRSNDERQLAASPQLHKLADKIGLILLFPCFRGSDGYCLQRDEDDILQNITTAKMHLPVNWDNVFLAGCAQSGVGAWVTGVRHPEHFAGLAVLGQTGVSPTKDLTQQIKAMDVGERAHSLPLLVIGKASLQQFVQTLGEKGFVPTVQEPPAGNNLDSGPLGTWLKPLLK